MSVIALAVAIGFFTERLPEDHMDEALCLTEIVHYESNGEGLAGKRATANVALTRAGLQYFPDDLCGVLDFPNAFSHRRIGKDLSDITLTEPADVESFEETLELVERALTDGIIDNTGGADHFYNPSVVQPMWASNPISAVRIGRHRFVKLYP